MKAILGTKVGMTNFTDADGNRIPCTVISAGPCSVIQVKTEETDGYYAVQIGYEDKKEKHTTRAMQGHFDKAGVSPKRHLVELRDFDFEKNPGDELTVDLFEEGDKVNVVGTSKGKGFQGVVKRHGFSGVGGRTHGQHNRERAPGSIGMASTPSRVFKGMRMAGRTGNERVTVKNLKVLRILSEDNLMVVSGNVPGHKGSTVLIKA